MPTPPTAAELRELRRTLGAAETIRAAEKAVLDWQQYESRISRAFRASGRDDLTASEHREVVKAMKARDAIMDLIEDIKPQRRVDDSGGERGIDDGDLYDTGTGSESKILAPDAWAEHVARKMRAAHPQGKALVSGSLTVPSVLTDVAPLPQNATRLLDLLPRKPISENNYGYLQQTVRTNRAAPVADASLKPTSVFTFDEIEGKAEVVAHVSEPIPTRYGDDHPELVSVLRSEMAYGVVSAVEAQVVDGSGTPPEFGGLLRQSGTTPCTFSTDRVTTLRKAVTTLQLLGEEPTAFVLNPVDVEALDLTRTLELGPGTGGFLDLEDRVLKRLPVVPSLAVAAGTGFLADWRMARLYVRQQMTLDVDTSGEDLFDYNLAKMRAELRANVAWLRPQAFGIIDLDAGGESS